MNCICVRCEVDFLVRASLQSLYVFLSIVLWMVVLTFPVRSNIGTMLSRTTLAMSVVSFPRLRGMPIFTPFFTATNVLTNLDSSVHTISRSFCISGLGIKVAFRFPTSPGRPGKSQSLDW